MAKDWEKKKKYGERQGKQMENNTFVKYQRKRDTQGGEYEKEMRKKEWERKVERERDKEKEWKRERERKRDGGGGERRTRG